MKKEINYKGRKFLMTVEIATGEAPGGSTFHTLKTSHLGARNWQIESQVVNTTLEDGIKHHTIALQDFVDKDKSAIELLLESLGFE